jgi:hypothetical protein
VSIAVEWVWSDEKNRMNRRKHRLSFEMAQLVFDDPLAISRLDPHQDGNRWQTMGQVGAVVLFVVHTWPEADPITGVEAGRIISARKATSHERRTYETGEI